MNKVLIAYNNDSNTVLHDFLESCADEAKQICSVFITIEQPKLIRNIRV